MEIPFPKRGLSDLGPASSQEKFTTTRAQNVRLLDPWTGRLTGSPRSGQVPFSGDTLAAKVKRLVNLVYDERTVTFTALGDSVTLDWSNETPSKHDALNLVTDTLGNVYVLDGSSIVKYNADGAVQWKIALPAVQPGSVLRALAVDDQFRVFAGVSGGSDQTKAKLWGYEQLEDNKTALLWELTPGWFTESLKVSGLTLYAAQNDTANLKSRMALYTGIGVTAPTLSKTWDLYAYPVNDMDVSPKDTSVATAHEPNTARGADPRSPATTGALDDMTVQEILGVHWKDRLWSWHSSLDVDGDGTFNANLDDGQEIEQWIDKSGNDRNWYLRDPDTGPILRKGAVAGRDTLFFNGTDCSMIGEDGISIEWGSRTLNRTTLPLYKRSQFCAIWVIRTPLDGVSRVLEAVTPVASTVGYDKERIVFTNAWMNAANAITVAPGNMMVYEETTNATNPAHGNAGTNVTPLPGAFDADGLCIVTYICDHGYDDTTGTATRSLLRVNGRPVDRWQSITGLETLESSVLGFAVYPGAVVTNTRFQGDIMERLVVCDSYDVSFGQTSAFTQRKLITDPGYPGLAGVGTVWSSGSNTELEQLEGLLAHAHGIAHKLPTANAAILDGLAAGNNGDTITIDGHVYTLSTAATPIATADAIKVGASAFATLQSLMHAINGTGTPGTDYGSATARHPSVWSPGVLINGNTANRPDLLVQRRDGRNTSTFGTTESTAGARFSWLNGANSVTSRTATGGRNAGHYPHPFFLYKTAQSPGGPPRTAGVTVDSFYSGLISPYGILAVWDPSNGKLKGALTTGGPNYAGLPWGGLGYGVRWSSESDLFCCGPRQALVSVLGTLADNTDLRKIVWAPESATLPFVSTSGATALLNWEAAPGAFTYHFPRMAVDKWNNVYVPLSVAGKSAAIYRRIAPAPYALDGALLATVSNITDDPSGYAVALDPRWPDLPPTYTDPRAERFFLGTVKPTGSNSTAIYAVRELSVAGNGNNPRVLEVIAVAGAGLYKVVGGGATVTIDAAAFDTGARWVDSAAMKGALFFVDGSRQYVYDPRNAINGRWRARSSGQIPPYAMLIERVGSRLVLAGFANNRTGLAMSKYGDPYGWDFDPQGDSPLTIAAISSELSDLGDFPDVVTCIASFRDDLALVGGDHSLSIMRGDPAQGGRFDELVKGIGVAFGRARCFTPDGVFWWLTNQAELYRMAIGQSPERISDRVQRRLADSIDFSTAHPEFFYDPNERCIRILQMVGGAVSASYTHWTYELDTGELVGPIWPDTYGSTDVQPTAACLIDGDGPEDRLFLVAGGDKKVRSFSRTAVDDDGVRIGDEVLCHMPVAASRPSLMRFTNLEVTLAKGVYGAQYEFYASNDPDDFGTARVAGALVSGRNRLARVRHSGAYCGVLVKGSDEAQKWALERMTIDAQPIARLRG